MKSRETKEEILKTLKGKFEEAAAVVLAGYKGLTVAQIGKLREELRPLGARFTVLKNTLARIASKGTAYEELTGKLEGPLAAAFMNEDPAPVLKALFKLTKDLQALELLEGMVEGARLDSAGLKAFSELPSKNEVRAMFCGVLQAPMSQLLSVMAAPGREMVGVMKAYEDKLEGAQAQ